MNAPEKADGHARRVGNSGTLLGVIDPIERAALEGTDGRLRDDLTLPRVRLDDPGASRR